jgi:hypothetical protein
MAENKANNGRGTVQQESLPIEQAATKAEQQRQKNSTRKKPILSGDDRNGIVEYMFEFKDGTKTPMPTREWKLASMGVEVATESDLLRETDKTVNIAGKTKTKMVNVVTKAAAPGVRKKEGSAKENRKFAIAVPAMASRVDILYHFKKNAPEIVGVSMAGRTINAEGKA